MPFLTATISDGEIRAVMNKAVLDQRGYRIICATVQQRKSISVRMYGLRTRLRSLSRTRLSPRHPDYGASPWDALIISETTNEAGQPVIELTLSQPLVIEPLEPSESLLTPSEVEPILTPSTEDTPQ